MQYVLILVFTAYLTMVQLEDEDVSLERLIYKGRGYRMYSALNHQSGKVVSIKVYEGSRAREVSSKSRNQDPV